MLMLLPRIAALGSMRPSSPELKIPMREVETLEITNKWYCKISNWCRILIIVCLFCIIALALIYHNISVSLFTNFLQWLQHNLWKGSAVFMAVFIACTVSLIPGSILTLGGGFVYVHVLGPVWGVVVATAIVFTSASIGATLAFLNGRYLLRECVLHHLAKHPKFQIVDKVVQIYGFSVTFWLRLSSFTPYNVFNYFMGCTNVRLIDYMMANIAMLPDITIACFVGGSISSLIDVANTGIMNNVALVIALSVTLAVSIIGMIVISYVAKRKFDSMVQKINSFTTENEEYEQSLSEAKTDCDYSPQSYGSTPSLVHKNSEF